MGIPCFLASRFARAKHIDFHHYGFEKMEDANRLKTLIDIWLDIVEKIET